MSTVSILQLTDLHVFCKPQMRLKGIPTRELLVDVIQHIIDSGEAFDAVVITGDHTHDELRETYEAVADLLQPWRDRLFQVPGNHDDRSVLRSVFSDRIVGVGDERINFSLTLGSWLCLGLDTHVPGSVSGRIDADQVNWIRTQMQSSLATQVVLFMHHPPVSVRSEWMDQIGLEQRELLQELILADSRIRLVCCGHIHHEFQTWLGHAEIVATPSTGIQFSPHGSSATFVAAPPGYRIIELSDHGYETRVIRLPETRYRPE
jgi:Icc protein